MTLPDKAEARGRLARRIIASPWSLAAVASLLWILRYGLAFGLRFTKLPDWANWFDQGRYLRSAQALAHGDLSPAMHWYPAAYPLLASPFTSLFPREPFFIPDATLFALTGVAFTRAVRPLGFNDWTALLVFVLSTLLLDNTALFWLEPWTTTLSATLIWWLIAAIAALLFPVAHDPPSPRALVLVGAVAGALPMVRPPDGMESLCAVAFLVVMLWRRRRLGLAAFAWLALGAAAMAVPFGLLHLAINGPHLGGYISAGRAQGFAFADLPWRAYVLLITPRPWFPAGQSLIEGLPLLVPGAAGLIVMATLGTMARRWIALAAAIALPYLALYLAYTDLQPPGLWLFNNGHYFKWLFPLFGLGLWFWLGSFGRLRNAGIATGALLLVFLPACFRLLPNPVSEDRPARMLLFRGGNERSWSDAYFASSVIADSRGTLVNVGQFHQVPDRQGERAFSIIRPFAAHPRRRDPGETPPFQGWQKPYGRYDSRVSFGLPCWIVPRQCHVPFY